MIIENGFVKSKDKETQYFENDEFQVYYHGLIYIPYIESGIESIKKILSEIKNNKITDIHQVRGHFFLFIIDKKNNYKYALVDNSGLLTTFIHENVISTSLLELAKYLKFDPSNLDIDAIVEFLHLGVTYSWHTLFKNVRRIGKDEIIVYLPTNEQTSQDKALPKIYQPVALDVSDFFNGFYESVKRKKMSVDLTGGTDSRFIVSLLSYINADFELAISGLKGIADIDIPAKISGILKKNFFVTYHNGEDITNDSLRDLFYFTDSQIDILTYHRRRQLLQDREKRGIELQLNGMGGVYYKDFLWLQEFPFYHKKTANLDRLYDLRVEPIIYPHHQLGEKTRRISERLRENTIERLRAFQLGTNTQTIDNIYYNYKMQSIAGPYIKAESQSMETYSPLLELDLIRLGFAQKRRKRFFTVFQRGIISKYCPAISRIRTTEGVTASSKISDILMDVVPYALNKQKRFVKQILRKLFKKTYLQETPTDPMIYKKVAGFELFEEQIAILKDHGILAKDFNIENTRNTDIGKFLVIGFLLKELDTAPSHRV